MNDGSHAGADHQIPKSVHTVVIGGGSGGAVVAGRIAEASDQPVLLLEAGPDYGAFGERMWPVDLLDATGLPKSHQWGYDSGNTLPGRVITLNRGRVVGGCSSLNGCAIVWGSRADYDDWAKHGNVGWAMDDLLPLFGKAAERLRVRSYQIHEISPYQASFLEAAPTHGVAQVEDLNNVDQDTGIAAFPANIADRVRWNSAFAYLDPVRGKTNLIICANVLVDRLVIRNSRVTGVLVIGPDGPHQIITQRVVLAAGTYGSPAILLRSGVGPAPELAQVGINPVHHLPGVGRNLQDHPCVELRFAGGARILQMMEEFAKTNWAPDEQVIGKARSRYCRSGFDLHFFPVSHRNPEPPNAWRWHLDVACMKPRSRGTLRLSSSDPTAKPVIDHNYLSDPEGLDAKILVDGLEFCRSLANQPTLKRLLGDEANPGNNIRGNSDLNRFVSESCESYYHPVGTCKMGPDTDPGAVVDFRGRLHGVDGAYVADASIMPTIPRANTNLPTVVVGERIARWLTE